MKREMSIGISGMHCAACSARVEKALADIPGVGFASVNLPLEEAVISYEDKVLDLQKITETITKLGFSIREELVVTEDEHIKAMHEAGKRMLITWVITIVVTIFMIPHMVWGKMIVGHHFDSWLMFSLSVFVTAYADAFSNCGKSITGS